MEAWRTYATICRLCLQKDGFMLGIFNQIQGKEKSICRKIKEFIDLQISSGDGLPSLICHRCLYKIELCLEFKQQCFLADATLRQVNTLPDKDAVNFFEGNGNGENNVVMVVDPMSLDYESEGNTPDRVSNDNEEFRGFENNKKTNGDAFKRHPCSLCNKKFSSSEGLRVHMTLHSLQRPFTCTICGKSFLRKRELDRHLATHTGMKPFKCSYCDKRFGRKDKLIRHFQIHNVKREHVCSVCGTSFIRRDGLTHHMKKHTQENSEENSFVVVAGNNLTS
ncbi:zinc finger protein 84 isoform X2 [Agrilus planipennis]|uniref:Zinc finger protein 84 isoform X2 n=1 Tax=Agrilus planipennis TaxID=224129 RepID=A0A1W4WK58_AGRPL|nr:zinc finger protein 84 isoform X2 [Agrilus planipennis]